jgi:hypothetical protein
VPYQSAGQALGVGQGDGAGPVEIVQKVWLAKRRASKSFTLSA